MYIPAGMTYDDWKAVYVDKSQTLEEWEKECVTRNQKSDILSVRGGETLEQAKKRDRKIYITDTAIDKVACVSVPELTDSENLALQAEHKALLSIAKNLNNSNEVLSIATVDMVHKVRVLGTEFAVDPSTSSEAYSILRTNARVAYLHNHPSTKVFSLPDILTLIRYSQIEIISVVTNQGEVYILHKSQKYDYNKTKRIFNDIYLRYTAKEISHTDAVKEFLKGCHKGGIAYVKSK